MDDKLREIIDKANIRTPLVLELVDSMRKLLDENKLTMGERKMVSWLFSDYIFTSSLIEFFEPKK